MGNVVTCQFSCDQTLDAIVRWLSSKGHIRSLKENIRALQREMEDLRAIQVEVKNRVAREERLHRQMLPAVQVWLTRVEDIETRVNDVLDTSPLQVQKLCICGLCSKNVCSSYNYGKSVFLLLEEAKNLKSDGHFEEVVELALISRVEERPTRPTIGQEEMLEKAWNGLMEDGVGIRGLHGMGGVGKTTLFKKIHNKFAETPGWLVIWVVVSQGANISNLQEDIAQKLHLCDDSWKNKNEDDKAAEILRVLKGKRFVLMLDDIWERVDLEAIGVPFPTRENGCKVAFTTRSREVCGRMGDHEPMQVNCLERDEAWELFRKKVGDNILRGGPVIVELARKVTEKCRGLPLALNVIGETMASKTTVQEWEHAIDVLTRSASEFSDMEDTILPILKYSYDNLVDEHIKSCFLYCALFPEDDQIYKERLIEYWICEGTIGEHQVIKRAMNKGYEVLGTLIRANLLTEVDTKRVVMHDVVREMALWISSNCGKQKETFVVQARVGIDEIPTLNDWGAVRRMSLVDIKIEEISCGSKCSELTTLLLRLNNLKRLSGEFIQSMQKLVVLDLAGNKNFGELPEQISELASLKYLDLSWTSIKQLPVSFYELKKLNLLDLFRTDNLRSISGISKLSSLRILKLLRSNVHGDASLFEELQLLEHLQVLTITISAELGLETLLGDQRLVNCINGLEIFNFRQKPFDVSLLVSMENLCELWLESCHVVEINTKMECIESETESSVLHNPTSPCFTNLSGVFIIGCHSTKDLTWLLYAPNLVIIHILHAEELEEIINEEKATNLTSITPFQKLEYLTLVFLPKVESIFWSPLPFPVLRKIEARNCPNLRKFPLNATSAPKMDKLMVVTEVEWEDEDTKNRFWPLMNQLV